MGTSKVTQPYPRNASFVAPYQLKAHLGLLNAFSNLRQQVQDTDSSDFPACVAKDQDRKWAWFVGLAVERFELWCNATTTDKGRSSEAFLNKLMPPLDVLMVWHSYLLNPACYQEDVERVESLRFLEDFHPFLEEGLPALSQAQSRPASLERVQHWENTIECPFDPFESMKTYLKTRRIKCPRCNANLVVLLTNDDGSGYLQENFFANCTLPKCRERITKEKLATRKLIRDIARNSEGTYENQFTTYIAGSLFSPATLFDYKRAKAFKAVILSYPKLKTPDKKSSCSDMSDWELAMVREVDLSLTTIKQCFWHGNADTRLLRRVFDAYVDDKPWSLDLVSAVLRQASFVQKMVDLKWTAFFSSTGSEESDVLLHATVRYHRFMELLASSPESFFVPTLDIDLAWHTHQLMPSKYKRDYLAYVGRFVDHDDKVERHKLSTTFDDTSRAWKKRFGQCYTHCGCPKPGDTMGMKLLHALIGSSVDIALTPPNDADKLLDGTHRSDHPAVYARNALDKAEKQRLIRVAKHEKRVKESARLKGEKMCPFGYEDLNQSVPRLYQDATRSTPSDCVASHSGFVHDFGDVDSRVTSPCQTVDNSKSHQTVHKRPKPSRDKGRRSRGTGANDTSTYVDYGGFSFGGWSLYQGGGLTGGSCGGGSLGSSSCGGGSSSSCGGGSSGGCGGGG